MTAIYITGGTDSASWKQLVESKFQLEPEWQELGLDAVTRVYIGAELCDRLLLSKAETIEMSAAVMSAGLGLTYMTPPVGDKELRDVTRLLEALPSGADTEVVFGDWGVARVAARMARFQLVMGRILAKTLRDPRVLPLIEDDPASRNTLGRCSVELESFRKLLGERGVGRVEFDNTAIGISMEPKKYGLVSSLHVPMAPVVRSSICHAAPQTALGLPCMRECEHDDMDVLMRDPQQPKVTYLQRGNAVYHLQPKALIEKGLAWAREHGARVVVTQEAIL